MTKLKRLSAVTFAAVLVLCAFSRVSPSQDKPSLSPLAIESQIQSLSDQFDRFRGDFGQRLDQIESLLARLNPSKHGAETRGSSPSLDDVRNAPRRGEEASDPPPPSDDIRAGPKRDGESGHSLTRSDEIHSEPCCRRINHPEPCCRHVYHREPCCKHIYHPHPCCRHVHHPQPCCRYVYHAPPCCRHVYPYVACCGPIYDPEPWFSELD